MSNSAFWYLAGCLTGAVVIVVLLIVWGMI